MSLILNKLTQEHVVINYLTLYLLIRKVHIAAIMGLHAFQSVASAEGFARNSSIKLTILPVSRSAINTIAHKQLNRNRALHLL